MTKKKFLQVGRYECIAKTKVAPVRNKNIVYSEAELLVCDPAKQYAASSIVEKVMKVMEKDRRIVSVDSDLGSTSGLEGGVRTC